MERRMKPEIKTGQWWETGRGKRVYIVGITSQVPGIEQIRRQPVLAVTPCTNVRYYDVEGKYYTSGPTDEDLTTLLPVECDSFDWKPEPKWRDARPEDIQFPNKIARFRSSACPVWERKAGLNGTTFRCDGKRLWVTEAGGYYGECQVQEDQ